MAKIETFACDICNVQKGEANHWWKGYLASREHALLIAPWSTINVFELPYDLHPEEATAHLCGEQHAIEWVSKNLTSVK